MSQFAFNRPVFGPMVQANPFGVTFYVSNTTNPTENQGSPGPTAQGRSPKNPFTTIAAAITAAVAGRGDTIVIQRGTYAETLTANKAGVTFVGAVPYGYPDHVIVSGVTTVTANACSFYNMEFFSNSANAVSVIVGAFTAGVNGSYFENCSFASDGTTEPEGGLILWGGNNHSIIRCKVIDNTFGLVLRSNTDDFVSHVTLLDTEFLEQTTADISTAQLAAAAATVANSGTVSVSSGVSQGVRNFRCERNFFGAGATTPTTFMTIVGASSGTMADNRFGSATHASSTISVPAGILVVSSKTEAGESTARPV